ncbi:Hypothetical predicted protein [Cloeon dipterum]|uniref:Uncharacterized protein n=1 Tax=Cloeon dipterum TaxID=197152 RepID=A0A8S1DP71_9INSE|nr:Hypothetical predicted protein [Cloeon dipterum]
MADRSPPGNGQRPIKSGKVRDLVAFFEGKARGQTSQPHYYQQQAESEDENQSDSTPQTSPSTSQIPDEALNLDLSSEEENSDDAERSELSSDDDEAAVANQDDRKPGYSEEKKEEEQPKMADKVYSFYDLFEEGWTTSETSNSSTTPSSPRSDEAQNLDRSDEENLANSERPELNSGAQENDDAADAPKQDEPRPDNSKATEDHLAQGNTSDTEGSASSSDDDAAAAPEQDNEPNPDHSEAEEEEDEERILEIRRRKLQMRALYDAAIYWQAFS